MSEDHDSVYSTYRPTSTELRADAGNAPPGRFKEEVRKSASEDAFAETDPITAYVVGTTTVTVDDWNELGHTGVVETQRYAGGGSQTLTDDEDGAVYRRYWNGEDWSEWEAAGGGGGTGDHVSVLETNAFAETDTLWDYPEGFSFLGVTAGVGGVGTWNGVQRSYATVLTFNPWVAAGGGQIRGLAFQELVVYSGADQLHTYRRYFGYGDDDWLAWDASFATEDYVDDAISGVSLTSLPPLVADSRTEASAISAFPEGTSLLPVTGAEEWNGINANDRSVRTEKIGSAGRQYLSVYGGNTIEFRDYSDSAWGSWITVPLEDFSDEVADFESRISALENP